MSTKSIKHSFTLFEILIVMSLLAVGLSVLTIQIPKVLKGERFERAVEQVVAKLSLAQELMLDFDTPVKVLLETDQGVVTCQIIVDRPLPQVLDTSINRYSKIKGIEALCFNGEEKQSLELEYQGPLGATPQGELTLVSSQKKQTIILRGTNATIHADYPKEILSLI